MDRPVVRPLGPQRYRHVVALGTFLVWLSAAAGVGALLWPARDGASTPMLAVYAFCGLAAVAVGLIAVAQAVADAQLTYAEETLTLPAGKERVVRWARIAEVHAAGFGREMALTLHGSTRDVPVAGTRWCGRGERAELVAEFDAHRRAAAQRVRRQERARRRAEEDAARRG